MLERMYHDLVYFVSICIRNISEILYSNNQKLPRDTIECLRFSHIDPNQRPAHGAIVCVVMDGMVGL